MLYAQQTFDYVNLTVLSETIAIYESQAGCNSWYEKTQKFYCVLDWNDMFKYRYRQRRRQINIRFK